VSTRTSPSVILARRRRSSPHTRPKTKTDFDWQAWRERVAAALGAMQGSGQLSDAQAALLLEQRTRLLASASAAARHESETCELASFALGAERYAIETRFIQQTLQRAEVTPVPGAAEILVGIILYQGELVPLFDARQLFGVAAQSAASGWVLVLGEQQAELALLVDRALSISRIPVETIIASSPLEGRCNERLHRGVTQDGLIVLQGGELLRDPRLILGA